MHHVLPRQAGVRSGESDAGSRLNEASHRLNLSISSHLGTSTKQNHNPLS